MRWYRRPGNRSLDNEQLCQRLPQVVIKEEEKNLGMEMVDMSGVWKFRGQESDRRMNTPLPLVRRVRLER